MFIIPRLPKTQEEEYKVYPLALSLCFSTHNRDMLRIFIQHFTTLYNKGTKMSESLCHCTLYQKTQTTKIFHLQQITKFISGAYILFI